MCRGGPPPPPPVYEVLDNSPLSEFITKTCYSMHPLFHQLPLKHTNNPGLNLDTGGKSVFNLIYRQFVTCIPSCMYWLGMCIFILTACICYFFPPSFDYEDHGFRKDKLVKVSIDARMSQIWVEDLHTLCFI